MNLEDVDEFAQQEEAHRAALKPKLTPDFLETLAQCVECAYSNEAEAMYIETCELAGANPRKLRLPVDWDA